MAPMKRPETRLRYESPAQKKRIERAAVLCKWSANQFIIDAAEKAAVKILTASKVQAEQLITEPERHSLNQ